MLRFWAKVDEWQPSGCWLWTGSLDGKGYGKFGLDGRTVGAHRVAYQIERGPIPDGLELDHLCCVPACVNPDHLEPVTHLENIRRNPKRTRLVCPYGHPRHWRGTRMVCRQCDNAAAARYRERKFA